MMMFYNEFNTRQKQVYAAICLWVFCVQLSVQHDSIAKLFAHLVSMLTANSLPDWEQEGLELDIIGRGDPLPNDVEAVVPQEHLEAFNSLVESCIEVGIVDMYGESTEQPGIYLERCIDVLKLSGINAPNPRILAKYKIGNDSWGEAISEPELNRALNAYGVILS